jgi:hypothetical protein
MRAYFFQDGIVYQLKSVNVSPELQKRDYVEFCLKSDPVIPTDEGAKPNNDVGKKVLIPVITLDWNQRDFAPRERVLSFESEEQRNSIL